MKNNILICLLSTICFFLGVVVTLSGQSISIQSGVLTINEGTLNLNETSLANHGTLVTDKETNVVLSGISNVSLSGSSDLTLHSLSIYNKCYLNSDLRILNSINLISGGLDLMNNSLFLEGVINGEREESRISSSGNGEIVMETRLAYNQFNNPGNIGLILFSYDNYPFFEIRRGHQSSQNSIGVNSIKRYFTLSDFSKDMDIQFRYFDDEVDGMNENLLSMWVEEKSNWLPANVSSFDVEENLVTASISKGQKRISLFPSEIKDVLVPTGFSPNGDGVNDYFIIDGIQAYPDNKLVIFNQWGDLILEAAPYSNDWNGESETRMASQQSKKLTDGTYFYVFYKNKGNSKSVKKGYFELKSNMD